MKITKKALFLILGGIILIVGVGVTVFLAQQQQDLRQRASELTPTPAQLPFGQALSLPTTEDYVEVPQDITLNQPFTLETWIKPDGNTPSFTVLSSYPDQAFTITGTVASSPADKYSLNVALDAGPDSTSLNTGATLLPFSKWTHVAVSVDEANVAKLFINGKLIEAKSLLRPINTVTHFYLGFTDVEGARDANYTGQIDEVRISKSVRYSQDFDPAFVPFSFDEQTVGLWHFDGNLSQDGFAETEGIEHGDIGYTTSDIGTVEQPVCQANISICSWDATEGATSYHYKITRTTSDSAPTATPIPGELIVVEGDVQAPTTSVNFTSAPNMTYTCEVSAKSECGTGEPGSATATCTVEATPTPTATPTGVLPTVTSTPTTVPPTPTATGVPPTPTATTVPPTVTPVPPTGVVVPPTATTAVVPPTSVPPTAVITYAPGQPTFTPTPTIVSPGSPLQTLTLIGGALLTILGAIFFFAL